MPRITLRRSQVSLALLVMCEAVFSASAASAHVLSVYTDFGFDDNLYVWTNSADLEPDYDCGTEAYQTKLILNGPTGNVGGWADGFYHFQSLPWGEGDFDLFDGASVYCGCYGQISVEDWTPLQLSNFRAVFQRRGNNGNKIEYGAVCTHTCQPSRVCISDDAPWAFFQGKKAKTPAVTRCQATTPIFATTERLPCIGSGVGLWDSFDDMCPF